MSSDDAGSGHRPPPLLRDARLDHVAVAVRDIGAAAELFRDVLGGTFLMGADEPGQGYRFVQYTFPGGKVELLTPIRDGFLTRFLEERGEGLHHVTFRVRDISAQVDRLRAGGIEPTLLNLDHPSWREAFLHPRDAHGVLVQLAESTRDDEEVAAHLRERFPEAALLAPA